MGACPELTTTKPPVCATSAISPLFIKTAQIPLALPLIEYTYIPERPILGGDFRFDLNSVLLERNVGPSDQRLTAEMRWQLPFVTGNGQLITIRADARGDLYRTTNNDLLDFPDIEDDTSVVGATWNYADWVISKILDGEKREPVEPYADLNICITLGRAHWLISKVDGAPARILEELYAWIEECGAKLKAMQPPAPPPGAAPPGPPGPGAPPPPGVPPPAAPPPSP